MADLSGKTFGQYQLIEPISSGGMAAIYKAYQPGLDPGRDVVGALVISKSTGKRSLIVASPALTDGKVRSAVGVSIDAERLAASLDQAIRFPADVVFYAIDEQGQTALHRAGDLIFVFPSDVGSATLSDAVKTMLSRPEGIVNYRYSGNDKTALFQRSRLTGWVFVLGKSHPADDTGKDLIDVGACCPTIFTTCSLMNYLRSEVATRGRDKVVNNYLFLTAGACGPCRFGQYHQSYEMALDGMGLRDFRLLLLDDNQVDQGAHNGGGVEINMPLSLGLVWAILCADVLTDVEYAVRPYEVTPGETDKLM